MTTDTAQTLVMIRTKCCESFKCGTRCSICPNRPENREAVRRLQTQPWQQLEPRQTIVQPTAQPPQPFSRIRQHSHR